MKSMTSRILALATMSLAGTALVGAQAVQVNMEWSLQEWSPLTYTTKDLRVVANIDPFLKPGYYYKGSLDYRMVSESKGLDTYELGFSAHYFTRAYVTEKSTTLLAYGVWYSVNEFKDYTEYWKGYALVTANSNGFQLQGTAPRGYLYLVDSGMWGKHEFIKGDYGWRSFGLFMMNQGK